MNHRPSLPADDGRVPPELDGSLPRDVQLTASGVAVAVVGVALGVAALVAGVALSIASARGAEQRERRLREAVRTEARVTQVSLRRGEHPRRIVTYAYEAGGRSHTGRFTLSERERVIEKGALVPVGYLASDPKTSWAVGHEPGGFPLWPVPLIAAALLSAAGLVTWSVRRQWVLLSEGRAALARITDQQKVRRDKRKVYRVTYEFRTLSGAIHRGRYESGKTPAQVGSLVPIVYHRENPRWSATYPLALVRAARARR